jgi:hypothetical protein
LDEESILFEKPVLDEEQDLKDFSTKTETALSLEEQILALGLIRHLDKTTPHDELFHQEVQAYCELLIAKAHNWMVFSNALFRRSINEFVRFKRMERALLQL